MLFTGDKIDGREAAKLGLVLKAVPADKLDDEVDALAHRMATVPQNQLMMQKLMVNQALDNMGLHGHADDRDRVRRHHPALARGAELQAPRRKRWAGSTPSTSATRAPSTGPPISRSRRTGNSKRKALKSTERVPPYLIVMVIFCETTGGLNGKWSASPSTSWSVCLPGGSSIRASVWPAPK